jgi:hypothetical protein
VQAFQEWVLPVRWGPQVAVPLVVNQPFRPVFLVLLPPLGPRPVPLQAHPLVFQLLSEFVLEKLELDQPSALLQLVVLVSLDQ